MSFANTGLAITKQIATTPLPVGAPFVAAVGAMGAVGSGIIASNKPKFATGGIVGGEGGGSQGADNVEIVAGRNERVITVADQKVLSDVLSGKSGGGGHNITINAVSSDGVEDAVLMALYNAQENGKVDNTRLSIGAE